MFCNCTGVHDGDEEYEMALKWSHYTTGTGRWVYMLDVRRDILLTLTREIGCNCVLFLATKKYRMRYEDVCCGAWRKIQEKCRKIQGKR